MNAVANAVISRVARVTETATTVLCSTGGSLYDSGFIFFIILNCFRTF